MIVRAQLCRWGLAWLLLSCLVFAIGPAQSQAQETPHIVSVDQLNKDAAKATTDRQANETALRQLFDSDQARQALKSAGIDYRRVDRAVSQLSDEDLARLAARSRDAKQDFAGGKAGSLSDRDLLVIIIVAVLLIALIAVLR